MTSCSVVYYLLTNFFKISCTNIAKYVYLMIFVVTLVFSFYCNIVVLLYQTDLL